MKYVLSFLVGWLVKGLRQLFASGTWAYAWSTFRMGGVYLRDPSPYLCEFRRKVRKNSERLDWQGRLEIEPSSSRLLALRAEPLNHLWGLLLWSIICLKMWLKTGKNILLICLWYSAGYSFFQKFWTSATYIFFINFISFLFVKFNIIRKRYTNCSELWCSTYVRMILF